MGLIPADVMNLVQNFVNRYQLRKNPQFKNNRTDYTWYYDFIIKDAENIQMRKEIFLRLQDQK